MKIVCLSLLLAVANAACPSDTVEVMLKDTSRKLTFTGFTPMVKRYVQDVVGQRSLFFECTD